jgi:hypothetical protein
MPKKSKGKGANKRSLAPAKTTASKSPPAKKARPNEKPKSSSPEKGISATPENYAPLPKVPRKPPVQRSSAQKPPTSSLLSTSDELKQRASREKESIATNKQANNPLQPKDPPKDPRLRPNLPTAASRKPPSTSSLPVILKDPPRVAAGAVSTTESVAAAADAVLGLKKLPSTTAPTAPSTPVRAVPVPAHELETPPPMKRNQGVEDGGTPPKDVGASESVAIQPRSMSFSNIQSPRRTAESVQHYAARLRDAFSESLEWLESSLGVEVNATLLHLPESAIDFVLSVFGGDGHPPAIHAVDDLVNFKSLDRHLRFATLAEQRLSGETSGPYQFRVRYFAGMRAENQENKKSTASRNHPDLKVAKFIKNFFTSIFNNPDNEPIDDCTRRARSLYITARSPAKSAKNKKSNSTRGKTKKASSKKGNGEGDEEGDNEALDADEESIICCLNFALMGYRGFFVNWIATSNEEVNPRKYGEPLMTVLTDRSFQNRHLASFLMKLANLCVLLHLRSLNQLNPNYHIVLQARTAGNDNKAAKFYHHIGFEEGGQVEQRSDLPKEVFPGFEDVLDLAVKSHTDYIHFIWDSDDISVFTNKTGTFHKIRSSSSPYFRPLADKGDDAARDNFVFPFSVVRQQIMILAGGLDFFFLPFRKGVSMHDFIKPNENVSAIHTTAIEKRDRDALSDPQGWLATNAIDFMIRW